MFLLDFATESWLMESLYLSYISLFWCCCVFSHDRFFIRRFIFYLSWFDGIVCAHAHPPFSASFFYNFFCFLQYNYSVIWFLFLFSSYQNIHSFVSFFGWWYVLYIISYILIILPAIIDYRKLYSRHVPDFSSSFFLNALRVPAFTVVGFVVARSRSAVRITKTANG